MRNGVQCSGAQRTLLCRLPGRLGVPAQQRSALAGGHGKEARYAPSIRHDQDIVLSPYKVLRDVRELPEVHRIPMEPVAVVNSDSHPSTSRTL